MTSLNVRQLLQQRQTMQQAQYNEPAAIDVEAADSKTVYTGKLLGFDANSGMYQVQMIGGQIIRAKAITIGALARNSQVQVTFGRNSSEALVDEMPS